MPAGNAATNLEGVSVDFLELARRFVYPRTDTPEAAWEASTNSGYAGAIMAISHMLLGGILLFTPAPIVGGLVQLGFGFVYILVARLAFHRSRFASIVILGLIAFDILIELVLAPGLGPNHFFILLALILAIGGFRATNAVFTRHGRPRP